MGGRLSVVRRLIMHEQDGMLEVEMTASIVVERDLKTALGLAARPL